MLQMLHFSPTHVLEPESSSFHCRVRVERQHHVIGSGIDRNVRQPLTELRIGALRMLTAKLHPVVITHRLARGRCQLHVQYIENQLGITATGRKQTMAVGVGWVPRRVIYRSDVTNAPISWRSALLLPASVVSTDVDTLVVVWLQINQSVNHLFICSTLADPDSPIGEGAILPSLLLPSLPLPYPSLPFLSPFLPPSPPSLPPVRSRPLKYS